MKRAIEHRCRACGSTVPQPAWRQVAVCQCGNVQVGLGKYGLTVMCGGDSFDDAVEIIPPRRRASAAQDS